MKLRNIGSDRKLQIAGLSALIIVTALSYIAHSLVKYILALIGIGACFYACRKLKDHFGIPLFFIRRDGLNYWGGAFGGLIGGVSGLYGSTQNFDKISLAEFGVDISLITIYLVLGCTLLMGTILQDIEDGYLEV